MPSALASRSRSRRRSALERPAAKPNEEGEDFPGEEAEPVKGTNGEQAWPGSGSHTGNQEMFEPALEPAPETAPVPVPAAPAPFVPLPKPPAPGAVMPPLPATPVPAMTKVVITVPVKMRVACQATMQDVRSNLFVSGVSYKNEARQRCSKRVGGDSGRTEDEGTTRTELVGVSGG
ncbi:unnamed protein product [Effrenium voratum]|nr:unnamed protein product [Effrenium voratum]